MDDAEKLASARTGELCLPEKFNRPRLRRKDAAEYLELRWGIKIAPSTFGEMGLYRWRPQVPAHEPNTPLFAGWARCLGAGEARPGNH
jgi:hypothetical protein